MLKMLMHIDNDIANISSARLQWYNKQCKECVCRLLTEAKKLKSDGWTDELMEERTGRQTDRWTYR